MPSQSAQTKRSAPVSATSGKSSNNKSSKGNSKTLRNSPGDKHDPNHPQHAAPILDATKASKKVAKAVRTSKGSKSKSGKTKKDKVGDGPEAELSDDEDVLVDSEEADDDTTPEPEERALPTGGGGGVGTASGPKEISMHTLIASAKPKDDHKISRGYEFVQSPASRLIIPADSTLQHLPSRLRGRDRGDSISSAAFSDEGWEEIQFEMDVDAFGDEEMSLSTRNLAAHKRGYADVVRGSFAPLVGASA